MAAAPTFKVGDQVVLKGFAPPMTVVALKPDGSIICERYEGRKMKRTAYQADALAPFTGRLGPMRPIF